MNDEIDKKTHTNSTPYKNISPSFSSDGLIIIKNEEEALIPFFSLF